MTTLYIISSLVYLLTALLFALDVALIQWGLLPGYSGMAWLRVHFVTLGFVTQILFGLLPRLQAARYGAPRPRSRADIWLGLNVGLLLLLVGIPIVNRVLIFTGGLLVFLATVLLAMHLRTIAREKTSPAPRSWTQRFYGMGMLYLLVGVLIGTGYWLGWSEPLRMAAPIEAHVHANNWGFLSLVFAGVLFTLMPGLFHRPLATERTARLLFLGLTVGALGLVVGPWWGGPRSVPISVVGLLIHLITTITLVLLAYRAFRAAGVLSQPGPWHVLLSYLWFFFPMFMVPFVVFHWGSISGERIEGTAPQALIYGWVLPWGLALVPYAVDKYLLNAKTPQLGGSWLSLVLVNGGAVLIWLGIFVEPASAWLYGLGYLVLAIAALVVAMPTGRRAFGTLGEQELKSR